MCHTDFHRQKENNSKCLSELSFMLKLFVHRSKALPEIVITSGPDLGYTYRSRPTYLTSCFMHPASCNFDRTVSLLNMAGRLVNSRWIQLEFAQVLKFLLYLICSIQFAGVLKEDIMQVISCYCFQRTKGKTFSMKSDFLYI